MFVLISSLFLASFLAEISLQLKRTMDICCGLLLEYPFPHYRTSGLLELIGLLSADSGLLKEKAVRMHGGSIGLLSPGRAARLSHFWGPKRERQSAVIKECNALGRA